MNFRIEKVKEKGTRDFSRKMNRFSVPAVLTDDNCKILVENSKLKGIKPQQNIFENQSFKNILARMEPSQVCNVLISENRREYNATLICGDKCRIGILNPVNGKVYINLSGYDVLLDNVELAGRNLFETTLFAIASESLECLKNSRLASFFRPKDTLNQIILLLETEFGDVFRNISCEMSSSVNGVFGDEADFVLVSALLLSFCNRYGRGDILSSLSFSQGEINLCIKTATGHNEKCNPISENEERWLYFINLLSEGNLWKFDWGINGNMLEFRLNMFEYDENSGFILREPEGIKEYVSILTRAIALGIGKTE